MSDPNKCPASDSALLKQDKTFEEGMKMAYELLLPEQIWPDRYCHNLNDFSFGLWNMNPGGGRFFKANREWIPTPYKLDLLKEAGVEYVEAHDTDILVLNSF